MDINPNFSLLEHSIIPCSEDCVNEVGKEITADEEWHNSNCPNHSEKCCVVNDPGDGKIDDMLRIINQHKPIRPLPNYLRELNHGQRRN